VKEKIEFTLPEELEDELTELELEEEDVLRAKELELELKEEDELADEELELEVGDEDELVELELEEEDVLRDEELELELKEDEELELELEREGVLTDEELEEPNYKIFTIISAMHMRTYQHFNLLENNLNTLVSHGVCCWFVFGVVRDLALLRLMSSYNGWNKMFKFTLPEVVK